MQSNKVRFWASDKYQACHVGECCIDGPQFPRETKVGDCVLMPVIKPDDLEEYDGTDNPQDLSDDAANISLINYKFRKRHVRRKSNLLDSGTVWERIE